MMNHPGTSSFPGYYSSVPPRPPDFHDFGNIDVKGEYIEDCDDIKEEKEDRQTPAPVPVPPVSFIPSQYSPYRGVSVSQGCPPCRSQLWWKYQWLLLDDEIWIWKLNRFPPPRFYPSHMWQIIIFVSRGSLVFSFKCIHGQDRANVTFESCGSASWLEICKHWDFYNLLF